MNIRMTIPEDAVEAVQAAADETGLRVSEYARSIVVKAASTAERQRARRKGGEE